MTYEDSVLDCVHIRQFAEKVARETKRAPESGLNISWEKPASSETRTVETKSFFGMITKKKQIHVEAQKPWIGPHWELCHRNFHQVEAGGYHISNYYYWVLFPDGQLNIVHRTEAFHLDPGRGRKTPTNYDGTISKMTAQRILELDHKHELFAREHDGNSAYGNTVDGPILYNAKGEGILSKLRALLDQ